MNWTRGAGLGGLLLLWIGLSTVISSNKLPSPIEVLNALVYLTYRPSDGTWPLVDAAFASCARIFIATFLASLTGVPVGILMGINRRINDALSPIFEPLRSAPIVAFLPLLVMSMGVGESMKVTFLWFGGVVFLITGVRDAVASVPPGYAEKMRDLGATETELVFYSTLPLAAPAIFEATVVATSVQWTYITVAELVNASSGIGRLIADSKRFSAMDQVVAEIGVILFLALSSSWLLRRIKSKLFPWEGT